MKNYTSIGESQVLVDLGLDPKTADCSYCLKGNFDGKDYYSKPDWEPCEDETDIPCWSVGALMKVIPPVNENTYTIHGTLDNGIIIEFPEVTSVAYQNEDIFYAVYNMVAWLLEKGIINKDTQTEKQ